MGMQNNQKILKYKKLLSYCKSITNSSRKNKNKNLNLNLYPSFLINSYYFTTFTSRRYKNRDSKNNSFLNVLNETLTYSSMLDSIIHSLNKILYSFYKSLKYYKMLYKKNISQSSVSLNPFWYLNHLKNLKHFL